MLLIDNLRKIYEINGNKIIFYPLIISFAGSFLCGIIVSKLPEMFSVFLYAFLFGVLFGLINKAFNIDPVVMPCFILAISIMIISLLSLFGGLYFGKIFLPIIIANIIFSACLLFVDSLFYGNSLLSSSSILYFLAGLLAILITYLFILIDWKVSVSWLYIFCYSVIIYIYLQLSLLSRLMQM